MSERGGGRKRKRDRWRGWKERGGGERFEITFFTSVAPEFRL